MGAITARPGQRHRAACAALSAVLTLTALSASMFVGAPVAAAPVIATSTTLTTNPNPAPHGEVTLTVTVSPVPTAGYVEVVYAGGVSFTGQIPVNPSGVMTVVHPTPRDDTDIYARFSGTSQYVRSQSPVQTLTVGTIATETKVEIIGPEHPKPGDLLTVRATVTPNPAGIGTLVIMRSSGLGSSGVVVEGTPDADGAIEGLAGRINPGELRFRASYVPAGDFRTSHSEWISTTFQQVQTTAELTLSHDTIGAGDTLVATATISPPPSDGIGEVLLQLRSHGGHARTLRTAPVPVSGEATFSVPASSLERDVWTAWVDFGFGRGYASSRSATTTFRNEPLPPLLSIAQGPGVVYIGQPLTFDVTMDRAPDGGTISLQRIGANGPELIETKPASQSVSFTIPAAACECRAMFSGTATMEPSTTTTIRPAFLDYPHAHISYPDQIAVPRLTGTATVDLRFSGIGAVSFECQIDGGPWIPCAAQWTSPAMSEGVHRVTVRSRDIHGALSVEQDYRDYHVDLTPPVGAPLINSGAAITTTMAVSVRVTAADAATIQLIRISNVPVVDESGLLEFAVERAYAAPNLPNIAWDLGDARWGGTGEPGLKTVYVQWRDANGRWSAPAADSIEYVAEEPFVITLDDGRAYGDAALSVGVCCAADPTTYSELLISLTPRTQDGQLVDGSRRPYLSRFTWTVNEALTDGPLTLWFQRRTVAGAWSPVSHATIIIDSAGPTFASTPASVSIGGPAKLGAKVPVTLRWPVAIDAGSGLARYEVQMSINGGAFKPISGAMVGPSIAAQVAVGKSHRFRYRAQDLAGTWSEWRESTPFTAALTEENGTGITYAGAWQRVKLSGASGGWFNETRVSGATATLTTNASSAALVASLGSTRGRAEILVDGVVVTTVDLYKKSAAHKQVVWSVAWTDAATHTVTVRAITSAGRPSVGIDAFLTAR